MSAKCKGEAYKHKRPVRNALFPRLRHFIELDRAVAITVLACDWGAMAGVVTVMLIARFLTSARRGCYYTFSSLIALQVVFEQVCFSVILRLAAHDRAYLLILGGRFYHRRPGRPVLSCFWV